MKEHLTAQKDECETFILLFLFILFFIHVFMHTIWKYSIITFCFFVLVFQPLSFTHFVHSKICICSMLNNLDLTKWFKRIYVHFEIMTNIMLLKMYILT